MAVAVLVSPQFVIEVLHSSLHDSTSVPLRDKGATVSK